MTSVPGAYHASQTAPHRMPSGSLVTVPAPVPARATLNGIDPDSGTTKSTLTLVPASETEYSCAAPSAAPSARTTMLPLLPASGMA